MIMILSLQVLATSQEEDEVGGFSKRPHTPLLSNIGINAVVQHAVLPAHFDHARAARAAVAVGGCDVFAARFLPFRSITLQADKTTFAPKRCPRITNQPIVFSRGLVRAIS